MLGNDAVEIPARSEDRKRERLVLADERILVQEADGLEADLGMLQEA